MGQDRIIIVDDDSTTIDLMQELLESEGYLVDAALSVDDGITKLKYQSYKALITDLIMPGKTGMDLFDYCQKNYADLPVIFLTAHGSIQNAVKVLKDGAFDYITKPIQMEELVIVIEKAITQQKLKIQNKFLVEEFLKQDNYYLNSDNRQYSGLLETIENLKDYNSTVLLSGETGTGKEVLARLIHRNSPRAQGNFVAINCGAIPENLIESELFGYAKGAFTGATANVKGKLEIADSGTLFLDEIEELPAKAQVALLRFIQEKEIVPLGTHRKMYVDVRIIAATNQDLKQCIKQGRFREDLYYRLSVFPLLLPPLRERSEDIIPLSEWFLKRFTRDYSKNIAGFTHAAQNALNEYSWPGNIRELRNCIERAVIIEKQKHIQMDSLLLSTHDVKNFNFDEIGITSLKNIEEAYIQWVLKKLNGNKTLTSSRLGISLRGLRYKLNK